MRKFFSVTDNDINSRLDRWFKRNVGNVPQSLIEKNLRKGHIKVNNKKKKSSYKLQKIDQIFVNITNFRSNIHTKNKQKYKPTKEELTSSSDIFVENNENFVVINKPADISVQSGTKSKRNILDILRKTEEFTDKTPFIVHRIDKETTGILIVAKNRKYAQLFTTLFRIRKIHKIYFGIVLGEFFKSKGTLVDELIYNEGEKKIKVDAITHFTVIDSNNNYSLLKLSPVTGRKHQLRKQLLMHGHPIVGDSKYRISKDRLNKKNYLMLHAHKINFSINNKKYKFTARPPIYFEKMLKEKYLKSFL